MIRYDTARLDRERCKIAVVILLVFPNAIICRSVLGLRRMAANRIAGRDGATATCTNAME